MLKWILVKFMLGGNFAVREGKCIIVRGVFDPTLK